MGVSQNGYKCKQKIVNPVGNNAEPVAVVIRMNIVEDNRILSKMYTCDIDDLNLSDLLTYMQA